MLDRVRIAVRPRTPWEAMDLGLALLRDQAGPAARVWAALALPLLAALALACRRQPWWAPLLFWWLKPALDRPLLHLLARATFGPAPGWRETFRAAPGYARRGLAAILLWRRFGGARALLLPVWQLEEANGPAYRRRRRVLLARGREQAHLLGLVGLLATVVLVVAVVTGIGYFTPGPAGWNLAAALFAGPGARLAWLDTLLPLLAMAAMAVVEPFYVAAGFGLYLNRRVQLEGWDLELAFRDLARRLRSRVLPGAGLVLAALLALGTPAARAAAPPPAPAGTAAAPGTPPDPKAMLAEIMQAPEFATRRQGWALRPRRPARAEAPRTLPPWVLELAGALARGLRWLLPAALVLALAWALWRYRRTLALALGPARPGPEPAPERLFGMDIRPRALPADLAGAALALWDQGDPRGALALLYRGALAHLVHHRQAPVGAAATEAECLLLAGRHLPEPAAAYFARLLDAWQATAYGGQAPPPGARDLCAAWAGHFPAPGEAAVRRPWLILAALAAVLAALLAWAFHREFAWEREETWAGYQGEARRNPYLAAQRLLERTGHPVRCLDRLPERLPPTGDVLVLPLRHDPTDPRTGARLARWVRDGGLLLAAGAAPGGAATAPDALFQQFGVRVAGTAPDPEARSALPAGRAVTLDGRPYTLAVGARSRLLTPLHPDGVPIASATWDRGAAVLAADLDCLANDRITWYDHPDFLCAVAGQRPGATVWIVIRGDAPRLWAWLGRRAWPALLALAALGLAALWAAAPRFGPLLPDPEPGRRSFLEHLDAGGRYQWRAGGGRALLAASRDAFRQRLVRTRPAWAALAPPDLVRRLAGHAGLPPDQVDRALHRPADHAAAFLEAIRTLRTLGNHL